LRAYIIIPLGLIKRKKINNILEKIIVDSVIIKKWIEPYVLLETLKTHFKMLDLTFDGFSKSAQKSKMYKIIDKSEGKAFGLYMKNVNKFYVFNSENLINSDELLEVISVKNDDCEYSDDREVPINYVDLAKAEAAIII